MRRFIYGLLCFALVGCGAAAPVRLSRVVLYQNGVGYFEHRGRAGGSVQLVLAAHEVDDVLTTLTVVDPEHPERSAAPSAVVPRERAAEGTAQPIAIELGEGARAITLAYAAPTAAWRASYRLVLPEERGSSESWLQAWAVVDNTSAEDWRDVELTLATDAPLSFAVDLRTPRLVERPNVTGYQAPPIALGPIRAVSTTRGDDGDGIAAENDRCPDEPEDIDGYEDLDGCPDPDRDADGILDAEDRCPEEGESFNGLTDDDGCPDRGRVVVQDTALRILEHVYFADGSIEPSTASGPVLDAIAQTLRQAPEIHVEVQGHADEGEEDVWRLSAARAAAVRAALIDRGVDASRLVAQAYGDTRPIAQPPDERNRRAELRVVEEREEPSGGAVRTSTVARSARSLAPDTTSGGTRFHVGRTVTIPSGSSAMVTILDRAVSGEDVLLYRIDPNAPGSDAHPFRAARIDNRSGIDLVPGPISLFSSGELVGQGLLGALREGENAFVPYGLDRSSHVAVETEDELVPARIVALTRGVLTVERTSIRRTRYLVEAGARAPGRLFVHHPRTSGYEAVSLPPGTESSPVALLVPIPIEPRRDARLTVEEHRTVRGTIALAGDLGVDLRAFLAGSDLDPSVRTALESLADDREALVGIGQRVELLRTRLAENAARSEELRRNVRALDERAGATSPLRRRMAERLDAATREGEAIAAQLATLRVEQMDANERLREAANALTLTP